MVLPSWLGAVEGLNDSGGVIASHHLERSRSLGTPLQRVSIGTSGRVKGGRTGVRVHHDFSLVDLAVLAEEVLEESDVDAPGETTDVQVVALVADFASPDAEAQPPWSTPSLQA